jgi:glycine oxidase
LTYDYLLIGQGLAGSVLAYRLMQAGAQVMVLDAENPASASRVAAGIINPITGRNFVKTWLADEAIASAIDFYKQLGEALGVRLFAPPPISWILEDAKMWNDWQAVSAASNTRDYVAEISADKKYADYLHDAQGAAILQPSGRVDLPLFIRSFRDYLLKNNAYRAEKIDYNLLEIVDNQQIVYKDIRAKSVIFCEGAAARLDNPFFSYLPFAPTKGEILTVSIPDYPFAEQLIKHKSLLIAALGQDKYWVGASYLRDFADELPTPTERENLATQLRSLWRGDFEIVAQQAALRPTVRDRKPFLGSHPKYANMLIFNGLGAKGTYLAPYFSQKMADYILRGEPLPKEVDIQRVR